MSHNTHTINTLRQFAITHSLRRPTGLREVVERLGFIQADPIRSPARAQDLILRPRVVDYRVGDLDAHYRELNMEEDFLYAYGFFASRVRPLLHPKRKVILTMIQKKILAFIAQKGAVHPRDLEKAFGKDTERNWWGGNSKSTKMALDHLHYTGHLRIAGREKGIRTYELAWKPVDQMSIQERMEKLTMLIISILQPVAESRLTGALNYLRHYSFNWTTSTTKKIIESLILQGLLKREKVDGLSYIWNPADETAAQAMEVRNQVTFLAPFDPVVWDRTRFEHFWGWPYRFEAYVPAAKRVRGYYAMPILWQDDVIGWVNVSFRNGELEVADGYVQSRPSSAEYNKLFDEEVERMREFLKPR